MVRIGVDARFLMHGVGRYTEELLTHLNELEGPYEYYALTSEAYTQAPTLNHLFEGRVREIKERGSLYNPCAHLSIPIHVMRSRLRLFHATSFQSPLIRACPLVVTIHDQAPRLDRRRLPFSSGLRGMAARMYYDGMNSYAMHYARHIITVSKQAKQDILRFHPELPEDKISVIYHGVSPEFRPASPDEQARVRQAHDLPIPYFLYMGTVNPGKNLIRVIQAFAELQRASSWRYKLVAVARADHRYRDFYDFWKHFPGKQGIHLLDYVKKDDLCGLYSGARALVFPSQHESFGFPLLEAFACGTPVITSNVSALPEIAGDAALLVDPYSVPDIGMACRELGQNEGLCQQLIERGFRQVRRFSWQACAQETVAVYERVLKQVARR